MRELTKQIKIGNIVLGGNNHVIIQSMTNTRPSDLEKTISQINELTLLGCEMVRVTIVNDEDAIAIKEIKKRISIPIVADIHFDYKLAILAVMNGADKIRINPGNIGNNDKVKEIVMTCQKYHVPLRIGINAGSLEKDLIEKYHHPTAEALLESMDRAVNLIESYNFYDLVLSIKASTIETTLEVNRQMAKKYPYPLHLGLTEAGSFLNGTVRSSYTLATLLTEGIGNTIRVSLHGDPCQEIKVCQEILSLCHLYLKPTLIVCPTCGRTAYAMTPIVNEIENFIQNIHKNIKIAIMGCIVNGPGEAKDADIGIAGGKNCAVLFKKGEIIGKYQDNEILEILKKEILKLI